MKCRLHFGLRRVPDDAIDAWGALSTIRHHLSYRQQFGGQRVEQKTPQPLRFG
jgi:hypothetical protein